MAGVEACQTLANERYAIEDDTMLPPFQWPRSLEDPLIEIARDGALRLLAAALRAEADVFVAQHAEATLPDGRERDVDPGLWTRGLVGAAPFRRVGRSE